MEQIIEFIMNNKDDLKRTAEAQTARLAKGSIYYSGAAKSGYLDRLREARITIVTNILKKAFPYQPVSTIMDSPEANAAMKVLWEEHAKD